MYETSPARLAKGVIPCRANVHLARLLARKVAVAERAVGHVDRAHCRRCRWVIITGGSDEDGDVDGGARVCPGRWVLSGEC